MTELDELTERISVAFGFKFEDQLAEVVGDDKGDSDE